VRLGEAEKELLGGARDDIVAEALRGQIEVGDFSVPNASFP
jgi:hypothetical protein